jgi:hypothetical protein
MGAEKRNARDACVAIAWTFRGRQKIMPNQNAAAWSFTRPRVVDAAHKVETAVHGQTQTHLS